MPELPEVETIVKDLLPNVINKKIAAFKVFSGSERQKQGNKKRLK